MKVTITVGGKWYALNLAEQLQKNGVLHRVVTSHPKWAFRSPDLDPRRVVTFPVAEAVGQVMHRVARRPADGDFLKTVLFDLFASTQVGGSDTVIGFASFCRTTMKKSQGRKRLVLERACPHILDQLGLLKEEAGLLGLPPPGDPRITDRMLEEYRLADLIIVPSRYSQKSFLSKGFGENTVRIVPLSGKFPGPSRPPTRDPRAPFRLLFVGGSFLRKGLIYLIRAWSSLRLKDAELILRSSDFPQTPETRAFLSRPGVHLLERSQDLDPLYSQASAFCLPSVDDGFGMVALEAMSYGLPVILTENVGATDCIRDGTEGFVVGIRDVDGLKAKILDLYEHPEKRLEMGRAAAERARLFTWETYGRAYLQALGVFA